MHAQLKNNEAKMKRLNDANDRAKQLESEKMQLEHRVQAEETKSHKAIDLKEEAERRNDHLRREIDLLTHDKNYLQRETSQLTDQVSRL